MKLITNQLLNYPFAVIVWLVVFVLTSRLLNEVGLTAIHWGVLALIGSAGVAFGSNGKIQPRETMQLLFCGIQTGISLNEGFYFLFWLFSLDTPEKIPMEYQDVLIPAFPVDCVDRVINFSFNAKIQFGKSNVRRTHNHPHPTDEENAEAKRRFIINKTENIPSDFVALVKTVCNQLYSNQTWNAIKGRNFTEDIKLNNFFFHECSEWGIDPKNLLPFVQPQDMAQQNKDKNRKIITNDLRQLYPTLSDQELARLVNLQLNDVNSKEYVVVGGNSGTLGRYDM